MINCGCEFGCCFGAAQRRAARRRTSFPSRTADRREHRRRHECRRSALRGPARVWQSGTAARTNPRHWSWNWLESLRATSATACAPCAALPGFSLIAILVMALCIGAATSLFTIVRSVLLRPLPFRDPGQLVMVYEHFRGDWANQTAVQLQLCLARRLLRLARTDSRLPGHGRWRWWQFNLTGERR